MPIFEYKGLSAKGKALTGLAEADGPAELRSKLLKDGVYLTQFSEARSAGARPKLAKGGATSSQAAGGLFGREIRLQQVFERVRAQDVAVMTRQFGTLLRAGIPMSEALSALVDQQERQKFKVIISTIREKVREGTALADALGEHRKVFPDLYVNMVRVGEASGTLEIVLDRLADFLEAQVRLRSKVTSALAYPIIMVGLGFLIVSLMMLFVIPRVTAMFEEMGGELPLLTRILIFMSSAFSHTWFIVIPALVFAYFRFDKYIQTETGRDWWDGLKLRLPVFGPVIRLVAVSRFARTLATLLTSGVPVLASLDIVRAVVSNVRLGKAIEAAKVAVREGESLAVPLQKSGEFPPMITHMIAIGEKTGQLESMLGNVAEAYDAEVDARVSTLTTALEPIMILGMGIMVAFLVFAILMPMLKMNEVITGK